MQSLADKVVIITGASEGIGRALAKAMALQGCRLVLTARSQARLHSLKEELSGIASMPPLVVPADVTDANACRALIRSICLGLWIPKPVRWGYIGYLYYIELIESLARFFTTPYKTPDVWFKEAKKVGLNEALEMLAIKNAVTNIAKFNQARAECILNGGGHRYDIAISIDNIEVASGR